ncbi:MoxR-like ATPase [Panacagrimonas perspica]|uniref:MoxR-like ATPase n=1 Tax=Panacagrimonas perspica TaxID=381431 RepID=A0A4S3KAG8_9GAMM|nr:MoxR family ATPase [Panacagrimonas perspica]TDU32397.1 MoxR-like ATPase [Panacagrimonas perspica]THD05327.1 AAA family ATPase [Panacagrimonas perspica]
MNAALKAAQTALNAIILGKEAQLRLALTCLIARGHLLIEDIPGVGKTTLALALAKVLGLDFQRVQFTSDLLPADILGVSIFEQASSSFRFHPGPVFAQIMLADEVNRASPKTQSALLEAMEERQVTAEGETRRLPEPFFVIATQNPAHQIGVFPLPESQLDRFLMRLSLGYPPVVAERALLMDRDRRDLLSELAPSLRAAELLELQAQARDVKTSPALVEYLLALLRATREHAGLRQGLSPRAGLALRRAAQAFALIDGRSAVIPEDVQAVFVPCVSHRLMPANEADGGAPTAEEILASVAIP